MECFCVILLFWDMVAVQTAWNHNESQAVGPTAAFTHSVLAKILFFYTENGHHCPIIGVFRVFLLLCLISWVAHKMVHFRECRRISAIAEDSNVCLSILTASATFDLKYRLDFTFPCGSREATTPCIYFHLTSCDKRPRSKIYKCDWKYWVNQ